MSELAEFMVHAVTVSTKTGSGSLGDRFADPVTVQVFADEERQLVRGADAREVVSSATVYDVDLSHSGLYALGSRVVLPSGRTATVLAVAVRTGGTLGLPDHVEAALT